MFKIMMTFYRNKIAKYTFIFIPLIVISCFHAPESSNRQGRVVHEDYNEILAKHVTAKGLVDYKSMLKDSLKLANYINKLGEFPPNLTKDSQEFILSYYINLYNAGNLLLVMRNYPLKSIKDIGSPVQIPFINTPWQIKFIKIGKNYHSLDDIEHGFLRKYFNEPRVHFALVCAAKSCPALRNEPYHEENLEKQLDDQTLTFLTDPSKNIINENEITLSKIFDWYEGDFESKGGVIKFIENYVHLDRNKSISYMDYDWSLNEIPKNQKPINLNP